METLDRYPDTDQPTTFDAARTRVDPPKIFSPTINDSPNIAGWLRVGGCTAGCGACCRAVVLPIAHEDGEWRNGEPIIIDPLMKESEGFADWEHWLGLHSVYLFEENGELKAELPSYEGAYYIRRGERRVMYIPIPCGKLTERGECDLAGDPRRPLLCADYPTHPEDIEGLESFCTYRFRPITKSEALALISKRPAPKRIKGRKRKKKRKKKR